MRLARQAGAVHAGLNYGRLEAGHDGAPPHCHSADEELFVILEGGGTLELWPSPALVADGTNREDIEIRAGHVISRPPSTAISHAFRAGPAGLTFSRTVQGDKTTFATTRARTRSSGAD